MIRRAFCRGALACSAFPRWMSVSNEERESLTRHLASLREECRGQGLDLADMSDAAKSSARLLRDCSAKTTVDDTRFKGKMATLSASVKAYNTRLINLQNDARSIQAEVDAVLKLLWGTEKPQTAQFFSPPSTSACVPPKDKSSAESAAAPSQEVQEKVNVERVEAERVETARTSSSSATENIGELEVETIEVEVPRGEEPEEDVAATKKITDITTELFEAGVNFSDCLDAASLRRRYRDYLSGRVAATATQTPKKPFTEPLTTNVEQPRMPPRTQAHYQQSQSPPGPGDGLAHDPFPNAHRKMVDPMKCIWELKAELAAERGIDASSVDLWSGKVKLEDHKRFYEYPKVQNHPIEVRQKGDIPPA